MNKLLLLTLLGIALIALSGANEENRENSLTETESVMENFETAELADAGKKNCRSKRCKDRKNAKKEKKKKKKSIKKKCSSKKCKDRKKTRKERKKMKKKKIKKKCRSEKCKKRNKTSKGQKNRKKPFKSAKKNRKKKYKKRTGKKASKKKKRRKMKKKKKKKKKNKNPEGKKSRPRQASNASCDLGCLDSGIKIMKIYKDKIGNYKRQAIRVQRQASIGKGKGDKKGIFKGALDNLVDAGGGDKKKMICAGNSTSNDAKQMTNLTDTLNNCSDSIKMACGNKTFPTPPDKAKVEACLKNMDSIMTMSNVCLQKTGAAACTCWSDKKFNPFIDSIKNCSLKEYSDDVAKAKKKCVQSFGKCKKYEADAGKQIHKCNQDPGKLKEALGAAAANKGLIEKIKKSLKAKATEAGRQTMRGIRAIATCAEYINASKEVIASISANPSQTPAATQAKVKEIEGFSGKCSADEIAALNAAIAAADASLTKLNSFIEKLQKKLAAITGTTLSPAEIDAAASAAAGTDGTDGTAATKGRMMKRRAIKNILRSVAGYV